MKLIKRKDVKFDKWYFIYNNHDGRRANFIHVNSMDTYVSVAFDSLLEKAYVYELNSSESALRIADFV